MASKEYNKLYYQKNREAHNAASSGNYARRSKEPAAKAKEYRRLHPEETRGAARKGHLKRKYGMHPVQSNSW